jgi:TolB-like protein
VRHLAGVFCGLTLAAAGATPANAEDKPVLAVLYFDNHTGQTELDVLQKGFADMMVTDLATVEHIVVVERARLQALLDELALQELTYFDDKTAVKLGKGLGATHAVTGSFAQIQPTLRIDVRMIEIATGKVVLADKVTGKAEDLFALEQELVGKFVARLDRTFQPSQRAHTRVPDVDTLLEYSRGIDLLDRGQLQDASAKMAKVVRRAPTFALARIRQDQIVARLADAQKKREELIDQSGLALARNAETYLKDHELGKLALADAQHYLAYRIVRGWIILRRLKDHTAGASPRTIRRGHEAKALRAMKAYYANTELLLQELALYARTHTQTYPGGHPWLDTSFELPDDDQRRAREADLDGSRSVDTPSLSLTLARFLLLGECQDAGSYFTVGPTLADLAPKFLALGLDKLDELWAQADAHAKQEPRFEWSAIQVLDAHAEALLLRGKREEAIGKWQEILDRYPTANSYERTEKRIKEELGLVYDNHVAKLERYADALQTCDDMSLRVGIDAILYRRLRVMGLAAIEHTVTEIERTCTGNPAARQYWEYLYSHSALAAASQGDCPLFDALMQKYLSAGGSPSSEAGYRKNYSDCPAASASSP